MLFEILFNLNPNRPTFVMPFSITSTSGEQGQNAGLVNRYYDFIYVGF